MRFDGGEERFVACPEVQVLPPEPYGLDEPLH
jgi:hypothetical protein